MIDKDGWREVQVICTNHDRHRRVRVATVCGWADGLPTTVGFRPRYSFPNPSYKPGGRSRESYQFVCSLCPRRPRVSAERWKAIENGIWRRVGHVEFDVSLLD